MIGWVIHDTSAFVCWLWDVVHRHVWVQRLLLLQLPGVLILRVAGIRVAPLVTYSWSVEDLLALAVLRLAAEARSACRYLTPN